MIAAGLSELVWSVAAPAIVVGVLLVLLLARQLARGGRLPLHDAPALRSHFTFQGPDDASEDSASALLRALKARLSDRLGCGEVIQDEGYATMAITRPASGLTVSLGFVEPHWLGFLSRGVGNVEPPIDDADSRAVLAAVHAALGELPSVRELRWHKYEAITRGDQRTADKLPFL